MPLVTHSKVPALQPIQTARTGVGSTGTVDVEVTSRDFNDRHTIKVWASSYFVELVFEESVQRTHKGKQNGRRHKWKETFAIGAKLSSKLTIKVYCKHRHMSDHVIGQVSLNIWEVSKNKNIDIEIYHKTKSGLRIVSGSLTLYIKVATTVIFDIAHTLTDQQSLHSLNRMAMITESLSPQQWKNIGPIWARLLRSLNAFIPVANSISELDLRLQVVVGAMASAVKALIDHTDRDEKIDRLIIFVGDLYTYIMDANSVEKVLSYKKTIERLLSQTAECAYFAAEYKNIEPCGQRMVVSIISNPDARILEFESEFRDIKIELILGSSPMGAPVSSRILEVNAIKEKSYIDNLEPRLDNASWNSSSTCLRGTRDTIINDLVQWASISNDSGREQKSRICVLQGPPRCGKSSIAHSVAKAFDLQKRLGAAIFLENQTPGILNSSIISRTIAFELAQYHPAIKHQMAPIIEADVNIATADIGRQFPDLIVAALKGLSFVGHGPICIIIDGIHKLGDLSERSLLCTALFNHFRHLPPNFHLIMTSTAGNVTEAESLLFRDCEIMTLDFDNKIKAHDFDRYVSGHLQRLFETKPGLKGQHTLANLHEELKARYMGIPLWISTACDALLACSPEDEDGILESIFSLSEAPRLPTKVMDSLYPMSRRPSDLATIHGRLIVLVFGGCDCGAYFFDAVTGKHIAQKIPTHIGFSCVAFSPDGRYLATMERDGAIALWNIKTHRCEYSLLDALYGYHRPNHGENTLAYSPDGHRLLALINLKDPQTRQTSSWIYTWNTDTGQLEGKIQVSRYVSTMAVRITTYGFEITALSREDGNKIVTIQTGAVADVRTAHSVRLSKGKLLTYPYVWSHNGQFLASAAQGRGDVHGTGVKQIWLFSLNQGTNIKLAEGGAVRCLAFSPDSSILATIHDEASGSSIRPVLCIWNTTMGGVLIGKVNIPGYLNPKALSMSFLPDGGDVLIYGEASIAKHGISGSNLATIIRVHQGVTGLLSLSLVVDDSLPIPIIQHFSCASGAGKKYAYHVDHNGWILTTTGERVVWVPYFNYEIEEVPKDEGDSESLPNKERTLEVKDPATQKVVTRLVIRFSGDDTMEVQ